MTLEGDKGKGVLFLAESHIKWLVGFLQRALAQVMIAENGLRQGRHRFLHAAAPADLQKKLGQRKMRERHHTDEQFSGARLVRQGGLVPAPGAAAVHCRNITYRACANSS